MRIFRDLDPLILKEVNQIDRMLVVQAEKLDKIESTLALILLKQKALVTPELEEAIKAVALRASSIDQKVPDMG